MIESSTATDKGRPYKPSWIDRFNQWVVKLPIRAWIFFAIFVYALIVVQILFLWLEGGLQDVELLPVIVFNGLFTPLLPALILLFDHQAVTALDSMRSVLDTTESEFEQYRYRLSNMPARPPLIAGLAVLVFYIVMERLGTTPVRYVALERLPVSAVVFHIVDKSSAFLFGPFVYHTFRQLRLVNTINVNHVRVSLFNLRPLQAFSRLTASTAVGLVVGIYAWMLINPELLSDPLSFGFVGLITILAVAVFVWPLLGVHRCTTIEKDRVLHILDRHFEAVFSKFNEAFRDDDYSAIERLNGTIASLEIQRNRIKTIRTWPWRPETARFVVTAITLPLILTVLQLLLEQALD